MVIRARSLAGALVALLACRTVPPSVGPPVAVRAPDEAAAMARRSRDALAAAEIAWVAANDRAYARERLDRALVRRPDDAALQLRRGLLALNELDLSAARVHLTRAISAAPDSPESAAALVTLHAWRSELAAESSTLAADLSSAGPLATREAVPPFHRALITALLLELDGRSDPAALQRLGGWLTTARAVGPLAPEHARVLQIDVPLEDAVDWRTRLPFRGVVPPIRVLEAEGIGLRPVAGGRRGLYLMQAFFRLREGRSGLVQARLPGYGRVKIDGFTVLERDPAAVRPAGLLARRLELERGWHRVTALVTAGAADQVALSLLDRDGRPMADEIRAQPPSASLVVGAPDLGPGSIAAFGDGHPYWLGAPRAAEPERALFGRLLAGTVALSRWLDDLESARAYLYGLARAAPDSASVQAALARLAVWSRLPDNLVQAHLREAVARDPTNPSLLIGLARRTWQQDLTGALEIAERAKALAPAAFAPYSLAYRLQRAREWHAEATADLAKAAARGAPPRVLSDGAQYLRNAGMIQGADALEALAIERSGPVRRRRLEVARAVRRGDLSRASALLAAGRPSAADLARVAEWQLAAGDPAAAAETCRAALERDPLSEAATKTMALAEAAQGRRAAARAALATLRDRGQTSPAQEALAARWGGPPLLWPTAGSWLGRSLDFDPLPYVAPLTGASRPRGLDAADRWAGQGEVQVLDRLVDRVLLDGSTITMRHQVVRLQTKEATDRAGEINLPPDALPLRLRTLKPDGSTVEVDRHAGKDDLSFSALAPGDAVEQQWVRVESPATPWGGYLRQFYLKSTAPLIRSELAVIVPHGMSVRYYSYHGAPQPTIREHTDHTTYYWRVDEVPPLVLEPSSPHPSEYVPFVVVAVDVDREIALDTQTQYLRALTRQSIDVRRTAERITAGARTPEEKMKAIFRWLASSISHGATVDPALVLAQRRGNRTGLFAAMLQAVGVPSQVVQARSGRAPVVAPSFPDSSDFSETLVRVPLGANATAWADMGRASPWLGRLPPWFRNGHYLTRSAGGAPVVRPIPDRDLAQWPIQSAVSLRVDAAGDAEGTLRLELPGMFGAELGRLLAAARPEQQQRQMQRWLASVMPSAQLKRLDVAERASPLAPLVLTASIAVPGFMTAEEGRLVSEQFFPGSLLADAMGQPSLQAYLQIPRRSAPLLLSPTFESMAIEVTFPLTAGAPVEGPRTFARSAEFGRIEQRFVWDDAHRRARLERRRYTPLDRIAPTEFAAFRDNAQAVLQASKNRLIIPLSRPTTASAARGSP